MAGLEVGRMNSLIADLERNVSHFRTSNMQFIFPGDLPRLESELERQRGRLRELLDDEPDEKETRAG